MKKYKNGGFYWERYVYQSKAYLSLNKNAMKILNALFDARKRETRSNAKDKKGGRKKPKFINLDRIEMPYGTLMKVYRMNKEGISKGFDGLLAKGFINITHHGGLGEHDKSRYALIEDYLSWKPGTVFRKRERDVRRNFQGKLLGATKKKTRSGNLTLIRAYKPDT